MTLFIGSEIIKQRRANMLYIGDTVEVVIKGKIVALRDSEGPLGMRYEVEAKNRTFAFAHSNQIKLIKKGVEHDRDSHTNPTGNDRRDN